AGSASRDTTRHRDSSVVRAVFYVACMVAQSLGFGVNAAGVAAFRRSQAPLGDLAQHYVGRTLATMLDAGAVLSAIGAGLGGVTVAARMLFAFAATGWHRDASASSLPAPACRPGP